MPVLSPIVRKSGTPQEPPTLEGKTFDQEQMLPLSMIRQHAKMDDVIAVPDQLLAFYRDAAFKAAEAYTGLLLREQRVIYQDASNKRDLTRGNRWRPSFTLKLEYPTVDGLLYLYGGRHTPEVITIRTVPGASKVEVPINHYALDMTQCCDPCGNARNPANFDRTLMYRAGMLSEHDLPPAIIMGALKYISWQAENPGSDGGRDSGYANTNPQTSGNNAAWKSGAIEEWRLCTREV